MIGSVIDTFRKTTPAIKRLPKKVQLNETSTFHVFHTEAFDMSIMSC